MASKRFQPLVRTPDLGEARGASAPLALGQGEGGQKGTGMFLDAMTHKKHWDFGRNGYGLANYYSMVRQPPPSAGLYV